MKASKTMLNAVVVVMVTSSLGAGGTVPYYDESDFISAVTFPLDMDSFEGLPVDNYYANAHLTLTVDDFSITGVTHAGEGLSVWDHSFCGHATDGVNHVLVASVYDLVFNLNHPPVNAFGLNITDWGDFGTGTLTFSNNDDNLFTIATGSQPSENELFFGVISTEEFNRVTLSHHIWGEAYGIDEVYYAVPEPATVCLLGLGGLSLIRRRRR